MSFSIRKKTSKKNFSHLIFLAKDGKHLQKVASGLIPAEILGYIVRSASSDSYAMVNGPVSYYCFFSGKEGALSEKIRKAGDQILLQLNRQKASEALLHSEISEQETLLFMEGMYLGNYQFLKFKKDKTKGSNSFRFLYLSRATGTLQTLESQERLWRAVYQARDLVNEPHSHLNAKKIAEYTGNLRAGHMKTRILGKAAISALRMGGLLAVNSGSKEPPTFTVMEYKPPKSVNRNPLVIVGKGIVYDTGGINLKTTSGLEGMKSDMAGAAAAGLALYAVAAAGMPVHLVALLPATDNKPSATAYVPGDIITISDGTTVEISNTDAEGRLILADGIVYASRFSPSLIMSIATLTGSARAAIGKFGTVAMQCGAKEALETLRLAGEAVYERIWEFPFWDEYNELIRSDTADLKNTGGRDAGAITAGKFLAHFAKAPFIHLDIAGPAFTETRDSYRGTGGTGTGVRLIYEFCRRIAAGELKI